MAHQVSKRAERDLKSIAYYIATESGNIEIAERQVDVIIERLELLAAVEAPISAYFGGFDALGADAAGTRLGIAARHTQARRTTRSVRS
jgi:hypothetical protein